MTDLNHELEEERRTFTPGEIAAERARQIAKGYDQEHDDTHGPLHLLDWAEHYERQGEQLKAMAMRQALRELLVRTALPQRNAQLQAVLKLHGPVDIYSGETQSQILAAVEAGDDPILTVCQECTPDYVMEQIGDCEWDEDSLTMPYPCATVRAIREAME